MHKTFHIGFNEKAKFGGGIVGMLIEYTECECGMDRESMTYKKKRCYGKECKKSSRQKGR